MVILGIDPGYALLGYGIVETDTVNSKAIDYGVIETNVGEPFPERLERLYLGMRQLIELYKPDKIAFEELFFAKNTKTALLVGAARGVAILAAQRCSKPLYEYTPMQIKLAVTGNGHADKTQVQEMIRLLLRLKKIPKPDDAADALAVALCHANTMGPAAQEFWIQ